MDSTASFDPHAADGTGPEHAVLAEVTCRWLEQEPVTAVILHTAKDMLVLEAADARQTLPPLGTLMHVSGAALQVTGRLAEHGRAGRACHAWRRPALGWPHLSPGRPTRRPLREVRTQNSELRLFAEVNSRLTSDF